MKWRYYVNHGRYGMKYLWLTYLCNALLWFTTQSHATVDDGLSYALENKKSCLASPRTCLNQIDENIGNVKEYSTQWYRLINFKLLAIWEIRDTKWLKKEIHQYVDLNNAPPVFLTTVYTLHAKMLFSEGNEEQGTLYANKSVALIKKVNDISFDADRYAEIIILYSRLNQYHNAKEFITWINKRIATMGPVHYFPKLQTAIAHTYIHNADYDLALKHYQIALTGFIETKYRLETAESYHNVARALQGKKDYTQAIPAFKKALKWMNSAVKEGNYSIEAKNYTLLRLIETLQQNGQHRQAKSLFKDVNSGEIHESSITLYQQLKLNELGG
jgi:tetratricopeptide (TPR) repeat protein